METRKFDELAAEIEAADFVLVRFQNQTHNEQPDTNVCAHCGQHFTDRDKDNPTLSVLNGGGGHIWIHHSCHRGWMAAGETEAKSALQGYGIIFKEVKNMTTLENTDGDIPGAITRNPSLSHVEPGDSQVWI